VVAPRYARSLLRGRQNFLTLTALIENFYPVVLQVKRNDSPHILFEKVRMGTSADKSDQLDGFAFGIN
jgi:hypothetical protein